MPNLTKSGDSNFSEPDNQTRLASVIAKHNRYILFRVGKAVCIYHLGQAESRDFILGFDVVESLGCGVFIYPQ